MNPIRIGIVGVGKIARDQHVPALRANPDFVITAASGPRSDLEGVPSYQTLEAMLEAHPELDAVALCTPPTVRHDLARAALAAGKHVLLEKPPGATLSEVEDLRVQAQAAGRTLFAAWHSRFAPAVEPARAWLSDRAIKAVKIDWREDVRLWHPGQAWVWEPGALGVFDPGINALSIATAILPRPFYMKTSQLYFPANRLAPIAADLTFAGEGGGTLAAGFDWRQTGAQTWDIRVDTDAGTLLLSKGGGALAIDGQARALPPGTEYPGLYARFSRLVRSIQSDVDVSPLRHVADAFLLARRIEVEAFED